MEFKIYPLRALTDNYIWLLADAQEGLAWVVDPGDAQVVIAHLEKFALELEGILLTHHHFDHSGGIAELLDYNKNITVCGSLASPDPYINFPIKKDEQTFYIFDESCRAFKIPGHTHDHMAYYLNQALFCGDTLFSAGCGKIFEGTTTEMFNSLQKIASLPEDTLIYCGHEYTLNNLKFAKIVDPNNQELLQKLTTVIAIRENDGCTLPSVLKEEKRINPFLRCDQPEIKISVSAYVGKKLNDPEEVFSYLRKWKNNQSV